MRIYQVIGKIHLFARKTLLWLIAISFFSGIVFFLYDSIPINFYAGWQALLLPSLGCALAFYLIYKNFLIGATIPIVLAYQSYSSLHEFNLTFSWWLLKTGPTVFMSLIFSIFFMTVGVIYIITGFIKK